MYLVNIPEPVQYHIYAMAFPFDLRCENVTYIYIYNMYVYIPCMCKMYQFIALLLLYK